MVSYAEPVPSSAFPSSAGATFRNNLGFSVAHQKVEVEVDFASKSLSGRTEITIHPHSRELRNIRLNCRQCAIKRVTINGKQGASLKYQDPYTRFNIHEGASVHQYHQLRSKLSPQLKEPPEEELSVTLPKGIHIYELEPVFSGTRGDAVGRGSVSAGAELKGEDSVSGPQFTPLTVAIDYTINTVRDGLHFVGVNEGDARYPHAYTRNLPVPGGACCMFPCVDNQAEKCTWEVAIKCPRTLADVFPRNQSLESQVNGHKSDDVEMTDRDDQQERGKDVHEDSAMSDDKGIEIAVVCSGDMVDEITDPKDAAKKIVSFYCATAISPQHVSFALGAFEAVNLSEFRETSEDDRLGRNAIPVHGFCLPGRADEVRNTCLPIARAMDFFTLTYGSYPFSSYKLCFVDDMDGEISQSAGLSLCSNRLLFPSTIIEHLDDTTRKFVRALAGQWIGVNIIPKEPSDTWVTVGVAYFLAEMFMKRLCGTNEYRFRQKKLAEQVCDADIGRPSIHEIGNVLTMDPSEKDFLALKAPLVLFILDRRLAKASGSSGLSRIVSRLFLNAKVGELPNGALTTAHFLRTCEKLGHTKLESFFGQWVYGTGCPRFYITQRFNKKKMVVEMLIKQTQTELPAKQRLKAETFFRDVKEDMYSVQPATIQPVFSGPMTIRIHEADGTPYEHIVEIKEASTKIEIPYNTKYKRLGRSKKQRERASAARGLEVATDGPDDVLLYCLGDVLQSEEEVNDWQLVDWTKEEEERMGQESFEWIRMDADFEWICKMTISMPGYMYLSQLQQDRDVVAQYESIQYIASQRETKLVSTILVRTLMDQRYFHGIRTAAAHAIAKAAKDELDWIGLFHLQKAFQEFFCFPNSPMTRSNDFSDRRSYFIQCAIPQAIARIRDNSGKAPYRVKRFLLDLLKFSDNANNEFSDAYYISGLMNAVCESLIQTGDNMGMSFSFDDEEDEQDEKRFQQTAIDEIERHQRMDEWISSYQNICTRTALQCKARLAKAHVIQVRPIDYLQYSREGTHDDVRLQALRSIVQLGLIKNDAVLRYFLFVMGTDPSPYVRENCQQLLIQGLAIVGFGEDLASQAAARQQQQQTQDGLVIEQEALVTESRQTQLSRTQTVSGALAALRKDIGENEVLKRGIWDAITSPIGLFEMRDLLDLCNVLFDSKTSIISILRYPRYWRAEHTGNGKVKFSKTKRVRFAPIPPRPAQLRHESSPTVKQENGTAQPAPRLIFKSKKASQGSPPVEQLHQQTPSQNPKAASPISTSPGADPAKPRLTLKLKMGSPQ